VSSVNAFLRLCDFLRLGAVPELIFENRRALEAGGDGVLVVKDRDRVGQYVKLGRTEILLDELGIVFEVLMRARRDLLGRDFYRVVGRIRL
jgi:hypothetical protein